MTLKPLWDFHPHVRSGTDLLLRERAADFLKHWFGTWTALAAVGVWLFGWLLFANDPDELILNLTLSCMAAVQGIVLQIAANRGDRVASELAIATHDNSEKLMDVNAKQLEILEALHELQASVSVKDGE